MGRPVKKGISYYPVDVDYYEDFKIMDLLERYGPLGDTIYRVILGYIYREGYYLETSMERLALSVARTIGNKWTKQKDFVLQVVYYCAEIGLFDKSLLSQSIITSVGIQRRYAEITVRSKVIKDKYWLLQPAEKTGETVENSTPVFSKTEKMDFLGKKEQQPLRNAPSENVFSTEAEIITAKTPVFATEIPQKKSKEKKSKVKQIDTRTRAGESVHREAPIAEIYALYNQICVSLPKVSLTAPNSYRERAVREIWEAYQDMDKIKRVFENAEASDFLGGKIPGKNWIASFDWIMRQENFVKIYEGNYSRNNSQGKTFEQQSASYDLEALEHYWENVPIVDQN